MTQTSRTPTATVKPRTRKPASPRQMTEHDEPLTKAEAFLLKLIEDPSIHDEPEAQEWRHLLLDKKALTESCKHDRYNLASDGRCAVCGVIVKPKKNKTPPKSLLNRPIREPISASEMRRVE